jgi:hypothetical protein
MSIQTMPKNVAIFYMGAFFVLFFAASVPTDAIQTQTQKKHVFKLPTPAVVRTRKKHVLNLPISTVSTLRNVDRRVGGKLTAPIVIDVVSSTTVKQSLNSLSPPSGKPSLNPFPSAPNVNPSMDPMEPSHIPVAYIQPLVEVVVSTTDTDVISTDDTASSGDFVVSTDDIESLDSVGSIPVLPGISAPSAPVGTTLIGDGVVSDPSLSGDTIPVDFVPTTISI